MNGKNARFLAMVATAAFSITSAHAIPRSGEGTGSHFLVAAEDFNSWHVGLYGRAQERVVEQDDVETTVDISRVMALAGYDILSWLTVYGTVGMCEAKPAFGGDDEKAVEYGFGTWFNLLDHDTFDFLETVQRFRIQGALQYTMFSGDDFTWGELAGNVTFGITHEVIGSKFFWPEAVSLFAGPAVNMVVSDEYEVSSDNMFGLLAGLDVQVNKRTNLSVAGEVYSDDEAVVASVTVRF